MQPLPGFRPTTIEVRALMTLWNLWLSCYTLTLLQFNPLTSANLTSFFGFSMLYLQLTVAKIKYNLIFLSNKL